MTKKKPETLLETAKKQSKLIDELLDMLRDANENLELLRTQLKAQRGENV